LRNVANPTLQSMFRDTSRGATGHTISHTHFPHDGVISHACRPTADSALEVATIGPESIAGPAPLLGVPTTTHVLVQIPGRSSRVPVEASAN
jgi:hypothetical protein